LFFKHYNHILTHLLIEVQEVYQTAKSTSQILDTKKIGHAANCSSQLECPFIQCLDFKTEIFFCSK